MLNILDEGGSVLGQKSREEIHREGLLHAEIHVWFYTRDGRLLFQHRAKDKDTFPDLLDATVGGHVEIGETFEQAALKEVEEETGLKIGPSDLFLVTITRTKSFDTITGMTNYALRKVYAYRFEGSINDLKVEKGKSLGFEAWSINDLLNPEFTYRARFIPQYFGAESLSIYSKIKNQI